MIPDSARASGWGLGDNTATPSGWCLREQSYGRVGPTPAAGTGAATLPWR